jgi:hypothetical protein
MSDQMKLTVMQPTSRVTKALITRAYLEMDLHLGRVTRALSNFLEDDLSAAYFGLSQGARAHLDRFRSFLHSFYVEKFGYWPPPKCSTFPKSLYRSMYFDFRNLYDFLVDLDSTDSLQDQKPASGGICVLQNIQAFDKRHKYLPLPHPLPLLPELPRDRPKTQSQRSLLALKLGTKQARNEQYTSLRTALAEATNMANLAIANSPLVKAYQRFEREWSRSHEEKVSVADARKVRWILIYGCLQMLVSVIRAPKEVRDTEGPSYPLCCLVAGTLPWEAGAGALKGDHVITINEPADLFHPTKVAFDFKGNPILKPLPPTPTISIHPDCETDDYFSHSNPSDLAPAKKEPPKVEVPASRRNSTPTTLFRNTSFKSFKHLSFSSRRSSVKVVAAPKANFCEILVHGYGNGLNKTIIDPPSPKNTEPIVTDIPEITVSRHHSASSQANIQLSPTELPTTRRPRPKSLNFRTLKPIVQPEPQRTPLLDSFDLHKVHDPNIIFSDVDDAASDSSTASIPLTPGWSSRSNSPSSASSQSQSHSQEAVHKINTADLARNGSLASDSSASATLSPITPVDVPEHLILPSSSLGINGPAIAGEASENSEGILIKRSFSVESFFVRAAARDDTMGSVRVQPKTHVPRPLLKMQASAELNAYQPTRAAPPLLRKKSDRSDLRSSIKSSLKRGSSKEKRLSVRISDTLDVA